MTTRDPRSTRMLRALSGEPTDTTPIWIMRQAGRYLPEYRATRAKAGGFLTLCKTPELACEVTVQPIERLGVDAAILFSDILIPIEKMGVPLSFPDEGPRLEPVRDRAGIDALRVPDADEELGFVMDAIRLIRRELDGKVPLIGFSGAPFTLMTYVVEGKTGKNFQDTKRLMFTAPDAAHALLDKLTRTTIAYLSAQVRAGAQIVQLFDSWVGQLGPEDFAVFAAPYVKRIISELKPLGVKIIYFANDGSTLLSHAATLGADALGVDWRCPIDEARSKVGPHVTLQGNQDPTSLFAPIPEIERRARDVLARAGTLRHVFNLGHGILPPTPPEHAMALVEAVHRIGAELRSNVKVAVVGAGPSGLAIALGLAERGVDVTVLEREQTVGGRVRTSRIDGYQVEHGPAGILSGAPATDALLRALGTHAPRVVDADPTMKKRYVLRGGKLRTVPSFSAFKLGEIWSALRERSNRSRTAPGETVAEFVRRRFGASLATAFAQPMVVGVFGGDFEALEVESAFPQLVAFEREHGSVVRGAMSRPKDTPRAHLTTFEGGMGALPLAMARSLGERVRTGVDVRALERTTSWRVADLDVDHIVLAVEPEAIAALVPELALDEPSTAMASVSLVYHPDQIRRALDGFGLLVPRTAGLSTLGIVFMSAVFSVEQAPRGQRMLRMLMGGPNDPALLEGDDATILARAHEEAASLLRITGKPTFSHLVRWPRAIPQYIVGHATRRAELEAKAAAQSITIAGTALRGIGVNDVVREAATIVERLTA